MSILMIDADTSGIRAVIVRDDATVAADYYAEALPHTPADGLVEFDADAYAELALSLARRAIEEHGPVAAVGISTQRGSAIVWDRATGAPISVPVGPGTLSVVVRSSVTFEPDTLQSIRWRPELIVAADTPGGRVRRATTLSAIPRDAEESPTFFEVPLEVDIPAGKTVRIIVSASHLTKVSGNPRHSPTARIAATFTPARPGEDPDSPDDDNPDDDEPTSPAIPTGNCVALNGQFQSLFGGSLYSLTDSEGASPVAELSRPAERLCASATAPVSGQMTITGVATPRSGNIPTDVLIDVYVNDRHRGTFASARQSVRTLAVDAGDRIRGVEALDLSRSGAGSVPFPLLFTAVVQIIPD